jgi:3-oxoacyl-[acyl-carrier protein] reductase
LLLGATSLCHYASAKAAIESFTKTTAIELGKYKIRANCVKPHLIDTPLIQTEAVTPAIYENACKMTALGRAGKPEEVANLIFFLATDQSSYISGTTIEINGGLYQM